MFVTLKHHWEFEGFFCGSGLVVIILVTMSILVGVAILMGDAILWAWSFWWGRPLFQRNYHKFGGHFLVLMQLITTIEGILIYETLFSHIFCKQRAVNLYQQVYIIMHFISLVSSHTESLALVDPQKNTTREVSVEIQFLPTEIQQCFCLISWQEI